MRQGTVFFIIALLGCVAVYDVIALLRGVGRATISSVVYAATYSPPYGALIPLLIGGLVFHLLTGKP